MSRKYRLPFIIVIIGLITYFFTKTLLYNMQFSYPENYFIPSDLKEEIDKLSTDPYNEYIKSLSIDNNCESIRENLVFRDLNINVNFNYPLVDFDGLFILKEDFGKDKERIIYSKDGGFDSSIIVNNLCFSKENETHTMYLSFIEKSGDTYTWEFDYRPQKFGEKITIDVRLTHHFSGFNLVELMNKDN